MLTPATGTMAIVGRGILLHSSNVIFGVSFGAGTRRVRIERWLTVSNAFLFFDCARIDNEYQHKVTQHEDYTQSLARTYLNRKSEMRDVFLNGQEYLCVCGKEGSSRCQWLLRQASATAMRLWYDE